MADGFTIPDQPYIEQIRRRLWSGREFGQAAVMVGAGFSRNAERLLPSTPLFPLWSELAQRMSDDLYPSPSSTTGARPPGGLATSAALRLATEYATIFAPSALDDLIIRAIPDEEYYPGRLHRLLLSLPWSDVFTTNYDTLLERTRPAIHDRKYDVVLTATGITESMKPRIVKLHGSFPAHRPFIVTEEDFRTYPTKYAPFVNLVQQAIMENALCLIGFSGEDPNFLYWTGWVRDNLGEATPPIYLCSLSPVSLSQRRVLEARSVFTIDLSYVLPPTSVPDTSLRYARALEWFLLTLMDGTPPNLINFPKIRRSIAWTPGEGVPPLPSNPSLTLDLGEMSPQGLASELELDALRDLHARWRQQRTVYPNWTVLPGENREILWDYTESWEEPVLRSLHKLPPSESLELLYELNWRLERCLLPISEEWLPTYTAVINDVNPFPDLVNNELATVRPDAEGYRHLDWGRIGSQWVELNFALAREARERLDETRFNSLITRLGRVVGQRADWRARWHYEQCMFWLFQMNQDNVRTALNRWPSSSDIPFWEVKRAAVLAEVGELADAERIAEEALAAIRARLQPYTADYALLSQEGWTMLLLQALKNNRIGAEQETVAQYGDRWQKLTSYRCNPWSDIEPSEMMVKTIDPHPRPLQEERRGFYPERVTVIHRLGDGTDAKNLRLAYSFLRMFEEGALPFRCGIVTFFSEGVVNAAKCIAGVAPEWSLSAMLRTLDDKELKEWFNYIQVAALDAGKIDRLYNLFITSLVQAARRLQEGTVRNNFGAQIPQIQTRVFSELLSRLCIRLPPGRLDELFQLAKEMYTLPMFRLHYFHHECVNVLFEKLIPALPRTYILQVMNELLRLPLPTENGFEVAVPEMWKEPFLHVRFGSETRLPTDFDRSSWGGAITNLTRIVNDGTADARIRATLRLKKLYDIGALNDEEQAAFGAALWSRIDPDTNLPSESDMYPFAFLSLPGPNPGTAEQNLRNYLISEDFPRIVRRTNTVDGKQIMSMGIGFGTNPFIHEWLNSSAPASAHVDTKRRYIEWSRAEIEQLLLKAMRWWDDEKDVITGGETSDSLSFSSALVKHFSQLVTLLSDVIFPMLKDADDGIKANALRLISEMEERGIQTSSALPMILSFDSAISDEVTSKLRIKLQSIDDDEVRGAISGIYKWLNLSTVHTLPPPAPNLFSELIYKVIARRQPALNDALRALTSLIRYLPDLFTDSHLRDLCIPLGYLADETRLDDGLGSRTGAPLSSISYHDRPLYRRLAARLSYRIFSEVERRGMEIPPSLSSWRDIAANDPLPSVREEWHV